MRKVFGYLGLWLVFSSCHQKGSPVSSSISLSNTKWKLQALSSFPGAMPVLSQPVTIEFKDGRIAGFAGCNRYFGSYHTDQQKLHFSGIGSTRLFCQTGQDFENLFIASLSKVDNYQADNQSLVLLNGNELIVRFEVFK